MRRLFLMIMLTLMGTMFCSSHESFLSTIEKTRFSLPFIQAINTANYQEAVKLVESVDFTYYGDSIDKQIDLINLGFFVQYAWWYYGSDDERYYQILSYEAQMFLVMGLNFFYSIGDNEKALKYVDDALAVFLQIGESRVNKYIADSYFLLGCIQLSNSDSISAHDAFYQASNVYRKWNIIGADYLESLFYLGASIPKTDFHDGNDCELAQVWDECYDVYLKVKGNNMLTNDYFLDESKILFYSISAYVRCGLKHKWNYEFDEAEDVFLRAIERNNQRKRFTEEPVTSLGNIEQYLLDCRRLRIEVAEGITLDDIFRGDTTCDLCSPYQQLERALMNASYFDEVNDVELCVNRLRKAHYLIDKVDSLPTSTESLYHNLCLSVSKDSVVCSFLVERDIEKSFDFLYELYPTLIDTIRLKLTYARSLIPYQMQSARALLDNVEQIILTNNTALKETALFQQLRLAYLICLTEYDIAKAEQLFARSNITLQDYMDYEAESRQLISKDVDLISSMWSELRTDSIFADNIDAQTRLPATILVLSSFFCYDEQYCQKWAVDYLTWRKKYLSKYISLIPEINRDVWLGTEKLQAETALYRYLWNDKVGCRNVVEALYDNELLRNEILYKSAQSIKLYLKDSVDVVASVLFDNLQQMKKRSTAYRQGGIIDAMLMDSIVQVDRVLSETTREYRTHKIFEESPTWESIRLALRENEVAIEFVSYDEIDSYGAFVLRKSMSRPIWISLENPFFITQSIDELRPYFQKRAEGNRYGYYLMLPDSVKKKAYEVFYDAIWKPLTEYIDDGDIVYYAPKGMLHYFPLQSIMDADSIYLMDKYNLKMVTSTGNLVEEDRTPNTCNRIALYGGIYYDETSTNQVASNDRGRIGYLPYSKKEVLSISSLCRARGWDCWEYTGSDATELSVKYLPEKDYSILHFATHNYYALEGDSLPLTVLDRAGLCLYNANSTLLNPDRSFDSSNDGILTASEISVIDLDKVTLVVLSACNTGLGEISNDGVIGLQRGFKMAGVQSIMMSLWPVDDAATYLLMTEFYKNYLSGRSKTESLREAQRFLRNYEQDGEKIFSDPKYWAAFVLLDALD